MIKFSKFFYFLLVLGLVSSFQSCVDTDFDEPDGITKVTDDKVVTIASVLEQLPSTGAVVLTEDMLGGTEKYIKATVTADDASGNFYKTLVFQDATGALSIIVDQTNLSAEFPTGNNVYVLLNGLYLGKDNNLPRLGGGYESGRLQRIPDALVETRLFPGGKSETAITPEAITLSQFLGNASDYYNKLVQISDVEFTDNFVGATYAIAESVDGPKTVNTEIQDCDGNTVILRNSGFASFASEKLPEGNGTLTAIASVYRNDLQLFIRDTKDVDFAGKRCSGTSGGGGDITDDKVVTIASVLEQLPSTGALALTDDMLGGAEKYIKATVTADDASGNFFKTLVFQDATGAMSILANQTGLNAKYPIGNTIYVLLNGLYVGKDNNLPRLGAGYSDDRLQRLAENQVAKHLISNGTTGASITPEVITLSQFAANPDAYYNKLLQFNDVQFADDYAGKTYAIVKGDDGKPKSVNTEIEDCEGNKIILRNSGYANFANETTPTSNGTLTAIGSVYRDDLQLFIRDIADVNFAGDRCDGSSGGGGTGEEAEISIASIQDAFYNQNASKAAKGFIKGIVISDRNANTTNGKNAIIQNGDRGILVRFSDNHALNLGDEVQIVVSDIELSEYRGLLQINGVPLENSKTLGQKDLPAPKELTVKQILDDNNLYESTRVIVKDATLTSDAGTFSGSVKVDDGTGTIEIYTSTKSPIASKSIPSGKVSVTAIVSEFNNPQLLLNSENDVK